MPIDPRIPLQVQPLELNLLKPFQQAQQMQAQGEQLHALKTENQMRDLELQDQQNMRSVLPPLLAKHGGDWEKAMQDPELLGKLSPRTALALQTTFLGNAAKRAQMLKDLTDTANTSAAIDQKRRDYFGGLALGVRNAEYNPAALDAVLMHAGELHPEYKDQINSLRQKTQQNPALVRQEVDALISESEQATREARESAKEKREADLSKKKESREEQLFQPQLAEAQNKNQASALDIVGRGIENVKDQAGYDQLIKQYPAIQNLVPARFDPQTTPAAIRRLAVPTKDQPTFDVESMKARMGVMGNGEFDQFLAKYAQSVGKTPVTLEPKEFFGAMQKYAELKQDPQMRMLAITQKNLSAAMLRLQEGQMPNAGDLKTLADAAYDKTIAPSQWQELRAGRMGVPGIKIFSMIKAEHPDWDMQKADAEFKAMEKTEADFTSGKEAGLVRSNNNAIEHLALLDQAREALKNGDIPRMNAIANWLGVQTGSSLATVFDHIATRVGDEVTKAFIPGGGGQAERAEAGKGSYSSKMGDAQNAANIRADLQLMDSQQRHLIDQYKRGTYGKGGQQLFTPEAAAARDRMLGKSAAGGSAAPPLPATLTSADVGKVYTNRSGQRIKITAVNPQDPKQFKFSEAK